MRAIETIGTFENNGLLRLENVSDIKQKTVKVILLFEDGEDTDQSLWLKSLSSNPAFDFLKDERENIYSPNDGKPLPK